jgi:OOP family OmpA-OmpF porin
MKKIQISLLSIVASSTLSMAGGDLVSPMPYEAQDVMAAEVVPVTPAPVVVEAPVPVAPTPLAEAEIYPIYVGLGLAAARYDSKCKTATNGTVDKTGGVLVRGGYDFNKYLGLEARGLMTSVKSNGGKVKHLGAFAKPMYPVMDDVNLYGLVGYAKTTTQGSMRRTNVTGLALGAGVEYDLSEDKKKDAKYDREFDGQADQEKGFGVFADYERLYQKSNAPELDAVSVGLTYDF